MAKINFSAAVWTRPAMINGSDYLMTRIITLKKRSISGADALLPRGTTSNNAE